MSISYFALILGSAQGSKGTSLLGLSASRTGQYVWGEKVKPVKPPPGSARYLDLLFYQGYVVQILGGKHFKTPEGEFVEMKSGTQYEIHVRNTHAYGKQ